MKKEHSISFWTTLTSVLSFMTVFLFFALFTVNFYFKSISNLTRESQQHSLSQLNKNFDNFYQQLIFILIQLSGSSELKQYLTRPPEDSFAYYRMQQEVHDLLLAYTGFFPYSNVNLVLYGENGQTYSTYNETIRLEETGILEEDLIRNLYDRGRSLNISWAREGLTLNTRQKDFTYIAHALYDPYKCRYYGTVLIILEESCFKNLYTDLITPNTRISILTEEGRIVSDSFPDMVNHLAPSLLPSAASAQSGVMYHHQDKWISDTLYNPYFGFYIVHLTQFEAIAIQVWQAILSMMKICCIVQAVIILCTVFLFRRITRPIHQLSIAMQSVSDRDLLKRPARLSFHGCSEARLLGESFNVMFEKLEYYTKNLIIEQNARHMAELNSLQHQINPHFLYNTLASLKYLCMSGQKDPAISGINALIKLLRKTLGDIRETIPLSQELELVSDYFQIQQLRYGNGIRLETDVPENCMAIMVPRFFLQPLIENSIFHGFSTNTPVGTVHIYAYRTEEADDPSLCIEVMDNGQGISPDILEHILDPETDPPNRSTDGTFAGLTRIGIKNVEERIRMIYGSPYGLEISSTPGYGTQILIHLPITFMEDSANEKPDNDHTDRR